MYFSIHHRFVVLCALLLSLASGAAETSTDVWEPCCGGIPITSPDFHPAPGTIGPNAFTGWIWHVQDAVIERDHILIDVAYRQVEDLRYEWAQTGVFRVVVPFTEFASLEFGYLVEKWKLNEAGARDYQPEHLSGTSVGDLIASIKFNLLKETVNRPAITLAGSFKTASGGYGDRRFTDSSGYLINALIAKDILTTTGILRKMRLIGEVGFMAWDDSAHTQNDAYRYGIATSFEFSRGSTLSVGFHGYTGWRKNGDSPKSLYFEGKKVLRHNISLFSSVDLGLNSAANPSANPVTFTGGVRVQILRKYPRH